MTVQQIKAMFVAGSRWRALREDLRDDMVIVGNTDVIPIAPARTETIRTVEKVGSKDIVFILDENQKRYWTPIPKAKSVIEARDGYLQFLIDDICKVTLQRLPTENCQLKTPL